MCIVNLDCVCDADVYLNLWSEVCPGCCQMRDFNQEAKVPALQASTSISILRHSTIATTTRETTHPTMDAPTAAAPGASATASSYLSTFLNRTLHLHTTDGRMFAGQMKCTDPERNIILSMTHEYRQPSAADIKLAAERHEKAGKSGNVKVDMKKRFVGLVVVPGKYITKIEVEG